MQVKVKFYLHYIKKEYTINLSTKGRENKKMKTVTQNFEMNSAAPDACNYCDEEKKFLMLKPIAMCNGGEVSVNINLTGANPWICLECLALDIDAMGHSVDIYEYEEVEFE